MSRNDRHVVSPVVSPVRTCIGCRERDGMPSLLRIVLVEGRIIPDPRRRLPGRGAWIHPTAACEGLATRRRAWSRALRYPARAETSAVQEFLKAQV